jgi:uncharacterized SAM-binding protein YcdF (DUF218 family)
VKDWLLLVLLAAQSWAVPRLATTNPHDAEVAPEIIVAFAEDPHRSLTAARLQRLRPGSELFIQGNLPLLELSVRRLKAARLWSQPPPRLLELRGSCDTVGQLTELVTLLDRLPRPGRLTVVTSRAHLARAVAIARTLTILRGWEVAGAPVDAGFVAPQNPLATPRDVLRALLWRVTGWHGRPRPCRQREMGNA